MNNEINIVTLNIIFKCLLKTEFNISNTTDAELRNEFNDNMYEFEIEMLNEFNDFK